jgi:hypothetical protein
MAWCPEMAGVTVIDRDGAAFASGDDSVRERAAARVGGGGARSGGARGRARAGWREVGLGARGLRLGRVRLGGSGSGGGARWWQGEGGGARGERE